MDCGTEISRNDLQTWLSEKNPLFRELLIRRKDEILRPDGDIDLPDDMTQKFVLPKCPTLSCNGIMKPNVVFFGDFVEPKIVQRVQVRIYLDLDRTQIDWSHPTCHVLIYYVYCGSSKLSGLDNGVWFASAPGNFTPCLFWLPIPAWSGGIWEKDCSRQYRPYSGGRINWNQGRGFLWNCLGEIGVLTKWW